MKSATFPAKKQESAHARQLRGKIATSIFLFRLRNTRFHHHYNPDLIGMISAPGNHKSLPNGKASIPGAVGMMPKCWWRPQASPSMTWVFLGLRLTAKRRAATAHWCQTGIRAARSRADQAILCVRPDRPRTSACIFEACVTPYAR